MIIYDDEYGWEYHCFRIEIAGIVGNDIKPRVRKKSLMCKRTNDYGEGCWHEECGAVVK